MNQSAVAVLDESQSATGFFPQPVKFRLGDSILDGQLEGYHWEKPQMYGEWRYFAVVTPAGSRQAIVIPITSLIDD